MTTTTIIEKGTAAYDARIAELVKATSVYGRKADYRIKVWAPTHIEEVDQWPTKPMVYDYICNTNEGYSAYVIVADCGFGSYLLIVKNAGGVLDPKKHIETDVKFGIKGVKAIQFEVKFEYFGNLLSRTVNVWAANPWNAVASAAKRIGLELANEHRLHEKDAYACETECYIEGTLEHWGLVKATAFCKPTCY